MSYIPQRRPLPPLPYSIIDKKAQEQPQPRESYERPKPKDPRTIIGWALRAFIG